MDYLEGAVPRSCGRPNFEAASGFHDINTLDKRMSPADSFKIQKSSAMSMKKILLVETTFLQVQGVR